MKTLYGLCNLNSFLEVLTKLCNKKMKEKELLFKTELYASRQFTAVAQKLEIYTILTHLYLRIKSNNLKNHLYMNIIVNVMKNKCR